MRHLTLTLLVLLLLIACTGAPASQKGPSALPKAMFVQGVCDHLKAAYEAGNTIIAGLQRSVPPDARSRGTVMAGAENLLIAVRRSRDLQAPPDIADLGQDLTQLLDLQESYARLMQRGMESLDPGLLSASSQLTQQATELLREKINPRMVALRNEGIDCR